MTSQDLTAALSLIAVLVVLNGIVWGAVWLTRRGVDTAGGVLGHWRDRLSRTHLSAALRRRWPRATAFIARRFDTTQFAGLPLTLIVIAAIYVVFLLAGIVEELYESEELLQADQRIAALFAPLQSDGWISVFSLITKFGNLETLIAVTLVAAAMLAVHGPQRFILPLWISTIGAQSVAWSGKYFFSRERPEFLFDVTASSPSFPSGHAAGSVSTYLLVAYILARDLDSSWQRTQIVFWLGATTVLICLSRIVLGVHYPSDVAAGALLGVFWIGVAIAIAELQSSRSKTS